MIRYGPAYSPWSNGINKRNHASCDFMVKKLIDEKKVVLTEEREGGAEHSQRNTVPFMDFK